MTDQPDELRMSRHKRQFVLLIAAIIVGGQTIDVLLQREHFPFSHYPMYAHETTQNTSLLRLYGTVTDGTRTWTMPIVESNRDVFVPEMNEMRMKNILAATYGNGKPKNVQATRRVLKDYVTLYEKRRIAAHVSVPELLDAECDRLTWKLTGAESEPTRETLVSTARSSTQP